MLLIRKNLNVYVHEANVDREQAQQKSPFCTFGVLSQEYQSRQIPDSANHQERREGNFCDPCPVSKVAGILKNLWTTTCVLIHECSHLNVLVSWFRYVLEAQITIYPGSQSLYILSRIVGL